jgi:uncharacterized membrane protein YheB (UPF0754 family)
MSIIINNINHYMSFLAPPLIGAFIGYLTNKVAIRMLFRPLKAWRILGFRVPMTPGVLPSKRRAFALNMGEMVGEHLLTSAEVGKALKREKFQEHLLGLIKERVGAVLHRDLGTLTTLIPEKFRSYFDVAVRAVTYQVKKGIHKFIRSEEFSNKVEKYIDSNYSWFLEKDLNFILSEQERQISYEFIETSLSRMLASPTMDQWVEDFVYRKVHEMLHQEKSLDNLLPASTQELILQTIEEQTPALLGKCADILKEPAVREWIVQAARLWIQDFVSSLGPMAAMIGGFLNMDALEGKIQQYLFDKKENIEAWLQSEDVRNRITEIIRERCIISLHTPLVQLMKNDQEAKISGICDALNLQILVLLRENETATTLSSMVRNNIETHIHDGAVPLKNILNDLFGERGIEKLKAWLKEEGLSLLRSKETIKTIDSIMETMIHQLLSRPVGRLSNLLPAGVRDGIYISIRKMASAMLATEVPGLVHSLNIRSIVAEKVDSLDLLSLERLLLSIMEEQFKYINLFGALLGFVIGCFNLLFL